MNEASSGTADEATGPVTIGDPSDEPHRLRRQAETFYALIANNPFGVYVIDADFRLREISKGARKVFETVRDALGRDFAEVLRIIWPEPFASEAIGRFRHTLDSGEPFQADSTIEIRADIEVEESYDWRIERIVLPDDRFGVVCYFYDLSERQRLTGLIAESEARFRFLDTIGAAASVLSDADAILATTTRLVGEHLGVTNCAYADMDDDQDGFTIRGDWSAPGSPSIVGHYSLADFGVLAVQELGAGRPLIVNDNLRELAPEEAQTFQDIGIGATICMPLVKNGRLTALMAIHDKDPRKWTEREIGLIGEVTERSWAHVERAGAEAELREFNLTLERRVDERTGQLLAAEEALRQSQKMEAVGKLTGGLAHDFNNLLTGIGGSLEVMQQRIVRGDLSGINRYVEAAQGAVQRAAALTHRLLAFSRRQTLDPKAVDPNRLVHGIEDLVRRTVGPAVMVDVVKAPQAWTVLVDPNQLENALLNLCINARDAMPDGGRLTIETANHALDEQAAREHDLAAGEYVSVGVTDSGSGMAPEVIAQAFDPFYTTKPIGHGTGLGLSMVYGFARQSGGQAQIRSEPGEGSTVCVFLPRHAAAAGLAEAAAPASFAAEAEPHGETILLIEDEPMIRVLVSEVLGDAGYTVLEAVDGPAALHYLDSPAAIDLVVTDVGLPGGMNGRQVADAARVRRPGLKVLFITGYAENAALGDGELEPGMAVLTKPFQMDALVDRVGVLLGQA